MISRRTYPWPGMMTRKSHVTCTRRSPRQSFRTVLWENGQLNDSGCLLRPKRAVFRSPRSSARLLFESQSRRQNFNIDPFQCSDLNPVGAGRPIQTGLWSPLEARTYAEQGRGHSAGARAWCHEVQLSERLGSASSRTLPYLARTPAKRSDCQRCWVISGGKQSTVQCGQCAAKQLRISTAGQTGPRHH